MDFVTNVRDVYHLSFTNKALRAAVTSEVIIRSGVWCADKGDNTRKLLENTMTKVKKGSIHAPSAFRLLRLLNGVRCERGAECYAYNRKEEQSAVVRGFLSQTRPFGLCICDTCFRFVSDQNLLGWRTWNAIDSTRIDKLHHRILSLPGKGVEEQVTREMVGPIMTAQMLKQIDVTYKTGEEKNTAINEFFREYEEQLSGSEKDKTAALVSLFEEESIQQMEETERKRDAKREDYFARAEARRERKRELSEPVLEIIEDLLEDYEHKEMFVLSIRADRSWNICVVVFILLLVNAYQLFLASLSVLILSIEYSVLAGEWSHYNGSRRFRYQLSEEILGKLLKAPSSATRKRIQEKVGEVQEAYSLVFSCKIGCGPTNDFLSFLKNEDEPHKAAIYKYRRNLTASLQSRSALCNRQLIKCLEPLRNGKPFEAIFSLLSFEQKRESFAYWIVQEIKDDRIRHGKILAKAIWGARRWDDESSTVEGYRAMFDESSSKYNTLFRNFLVYTRTKGFKKFMRESTPPSRHPHLNFTREDALEKILGLKYGTETMLEERDWYELLALHKRMFNTPHTYRYG